jgi:PAS domain S-box-containing protein
MIIDTQRGKIMPHSKAKKTRGKIDRKKNISVLEKEMSLIKQQAHDFQEILNQSHTATLIHNQGKILYVNNAWCELHQTHPKDALNKHIKNFSSPEITTPEIDKTFAYATPKKLIRFIEKTLSTERLSKQHENNSAADSVCEEILVKDNGELRWLKSHSSPIFFAGEKAILKTEYDITNQVFIEIRATESEERYKALFEKTMVNIVLMGEEGEHFFNKNAYEVLGYTREEFETITLDRTEAIKNKNQVDKHNQRIIDQEKVEIFETQLRHKNGHLIDMLIHASPITIGGKHYVQNVSIDISDRKKAERALKKAHDELENRIVERTMELKEQSKALKETNIALKVLLKQRDDDKKNLENKVLRNLQELVSPNLEKLKNTSLTTAQQSYIDTLEFNIQEIISPFLQKISIKTLNFTPSEIQIANLIKQGKTSKEIANHLNVSDKTIEFHRNNIRKKLGLNNVKTNLRSYLLSIC